MFKVLFMCTANICRSPLAQVILEQKVKDQDIEYMIDSDSSGTWATEGQRAGRLSQMVATENYLDLSKHRSKPITLGLIKESDLILCMTPNHKSDLLQIFPHYDDRIFTLKEYGHNSPPPKISVDDPIGMNLNFYRRIFREIEDEITRIWPVILEKSNAKATIG